MGRNGFYLAAATIVAGAQLSGCSTTDMKATANLEPTQQQTDVASNEVDIALPETVAVLPASYAAPGASEIAALQPAAAAATPQQATVTASAATPAAPSNPAPAAPQVAAVAEAAAQAPAAVAAEKQAEVAKAQVASAEAATLATAEAKQTPAKAETAKAAAISVFPPAPPAPTGQAKQVIVTAMPARQAVASALPGLKPQTVAYATPDKPLAIPMPGAAEAKASGGGSLDALIVKYATVYEVPVELVRRVVKRESNFRPNAYNKGHWGLMQIKHATARGMGYDGPANGLLDAETNLKYSVKYLRGAFLVADGNHDYADKLYQRGYYFDAKRKGLLDETGMGRDRVRSRVAPAVTVSAEPEVQLGLF